MAYVNKPKAVAVREAYYYEDSSRQAIQSEQIKVVHNENDLQQLDVTVEESIH
jgi:hypothetical protein